MENVVRLVEGGPEVDLELALIHDQEMKDVVALDRLQKVQTVTPIGAHPVSMPSRIRLLFNGMKVNYIYIHIYIRLSRNKVIF